MYFMLFYVTLLLAKFQLNVICHNDWLSCVGDLVHNLAVSNDQSVTEALKLLMITLRMKWLMIKKKKKDLIEL